MWDGKQIEIKTWTCLVIKFWTTSWFIIKAFDYSISIFLRNHFIMSLGKQVSQDRHVRHVTLLVSSTLFDCAHFLLRILKNQQSCCLADNLPCCKQNLVIGIPPLSLGLSNIKLFNCWNNFQWPWKIGCDWIGKSCRITNKLWGVHARG